MIDATERTVLVVGDWVVDENWTVTPDTSITSTEPLGIYYQSSVARDGRMHNLSGAGLVARTLYEATRAENGGIPLPLTLVGLGLWARNDGDSLKRLIIEAGGVNNPYQLVPTRRTDDSNVGDKASHRLAVELVNLADYLRPAGDEFCTTHAFQVFQNRPSGDLHLALRLDWERPQAPFSREEGHHAWELPKEKERDLEQRLRSYVQIDAIVVKCLGKGVMSKPLVELLKRVFPETPWFVSSKHGRKASWLETMNRKMLRLLFLSPSSLANEDVVQWRAGNSQPSYEAVEYLKKLKQAYRDPPGPEACTIVVMPRPLSLLTLYADPCARVYNGFSPYFDDPGRVVSRMGTSSVLFSHLVAATMLRSGARVSGSAFNIALKDSFDWWVTAKQSLGDRSIPREDRKPGVPYCVEWEETVRQWTESRTGLGIIKGDNDQLCFDLWRGMSAVQGYVALTSARRDAASRLYKMVKEFAEAEPAPERSSSCLLTDAPGRGKSSLVKALAGVLGIEFREIDLSQIGDRGDLITRLDSIVTDQAEMKRRFLILVDEIDSDDGQWYGQFLAPLESGYYIRGGNRFYIKPCSWVFAQSTGMDVGSGAKVRPVLKRSSKFPDFKSRLTEGEIQLSNLRQPIGKDQEGAERLERVYIAVSILRHQFPHLRYVTPSVLFAFYRLDLATEIRRIRNLVRQVRKIRENTVWWRDISFVPRAQNLGRLLSLSKDFKSVAGIRGPEDDRLVLLRDS